MIMVMIIMILLVLIVAKRGYLKGAGSGRDTHKKKQRTANISTTPFGETESAELISSLRARVWTVVLGGNEKFCILKEWIKMLVDNIVG